MRPVAALEHPLDADRRPPRQRRRLQPTKRGRAIVAIASGFASILLIFCVTFAVGGLVSSSSGNAGNPTNAAPVDHGGASGGFDNSVQADPAPPTQTAPRSADPDTDLQGFSQSVVADVQDSWQKMFSAQGNQYRQAQMQLYSGGVQTACGSATSAVGPFYCPSDETVYIDPSFYQQMRNQLGASGDFAWAYVIAHELGHHVQTLTGTAQKVEQETQADPSRANDLSIRTELQADCYAGVWGQTAYKQGQLEDGDLDEGLNAAAAVGDDRIEGSTGSIDPDTFTHGTSAQRVKWFKTGFDSGKPDSCDTFTPASV